MATTLSPSTKGLFGVPADETGFIIQSVTQEYGADEKTIKDRTGNNIGIAKYNESVKITLEGWQKAASDTPFSGKLAASLTLGTPLSAHLQGSVSGGTVITDTINKRYQIEDYATITINATYWPLVTT